ncbi:hypothetical protein, partial [Adhaeribacter aerolatus]|uniref:hypothetical protein n=1 Tax=Adhaeribacter aerolatus TaxID=670289 RepID=UPI001C3FF46B
MNNIYNCTSGAGSVLPNQLQVLWRYVMVLAAILFLSSNASAQITVDGNPSDWAGIYTNNSVVVKTLVRDANNTNDDQFTGGSQDPDLISEWSWVNGQTNDKGDISNAGAALIGCNLYFFGDRTAINGDAQIGFWFFKGQVSPTGSGTTNSTFSGQHQVGDLLILSNFTNGGGTPTVRVYEWVGAGGSDGPLNLLTTATSSGAVNTTSYPVPNVTYEGDTWSYAAKVGPAGIYPTGSFFEGSVNLCTLYGQQSTPCFSSFLLETRNSQSTSASLQDFAAGGFDVTPIKYAITGSSFCSTTATTGSITLADSQPGVSYQLLNSTDQAVQDPKSGTGEQLVWTNVAPGTGYRIVATRAGFNCPTFTDRVDVTLFPAVVVEAGGPDSRCQSTSTQVIALTGASVTGGATTGTWTIVSSNPAGANTLTNTTLAAGSLTVAANYTGTITLQLASPDPTGPCPAVTDTRIINISPAATVEAGEPLTACQTTTAQVVA